MRGCLRLTDNWSVTSRFFCILDITLQLYGKAWQWTLVTWQISLFRRWVLKYVLIPAVEWKMCDKSDMYREQNQEKPLMMSARRSVAWGRSTPYISSIYTSARIVPVQSGKLKYLQVLLTEDCKVAYEKVAVSSRIYKSIFNVGIAVQR